MSIRAGIVVTGTEVLTGRVPDGNGPWVAEQLRRLGVDIAETTIVGDRPDDLAAAVRRQCSLHDLVITTGGLGPTADDLTAEVVARVQGTELVFDEALHDRIGAIVARLAAARGWASPDADLDAGIRKQAMVPRGALVIEPTGTAPGLVVPAADGLGAPVLVLPGPPRELQAMWPAAIASRAVADVVGRAVELRQSTVRLWGPPEAELASALRDHEAGPAGGGYGALEVTTCLRQGELEVVSRYAPSAQPAQDALVAALHERFGAQVFSTDGAQVEQLLAAALTERGESVATAESCTAGMLAARLTDLAGSSAYVRGGFVTYHDDVKRSQLGVAPELLASVGAVSEEVAVAMAQAARERLEATYGVGITGIAGPGGATPTKPVGLVHVCVAGPQTLVHRRLQLSGSRAHVRERTVQWALHLLREAVQAP